MTVRVGSGPAAGSAATAAAHAVVLSMMAIFTLDLEREHTHKGRHPDMSLPRIREPI
jgi:hypothetical protein